MVSSHFQTGQAVVIGAGIAGLCSAARLRAAGYQVTLIEQSRDPGGKIRAVPSKAGPVDAGPTVMTLKPVFDDVFATLGERLDDHLHIEKAPVVARHFWPDGSQLDLTHEVEANRA
ncbi:MAG: FAD-dependent oxidoreductase, partial [Pseudomonadota bacterium]